MAFGSWVVEAGTRKERMTFIWDGKESHLRVERTQMNAGSGHAAPPPTIIAQEGLGRASDAKIFEEVERILLGG
jgi:hypothetical protein